MNTTVTNKPVSQESTSLTDQVAEGVQTALRSTQKVANTAFDQLSEKVDSTRETAAPLLNRLASQAENAARLSVDAVRETSVQLRDKALRSTDKAADLIRSEPLKAILIAAATGAALMALYSLINRSDRAD